MPTVAQSITESKSAGYKSADENAMKTALRGGSLAKKTPVLIFVTRRIIQKIYNRDQAYEGLQVVADYLYWLSKRTV